MLRGGAAARQQNATVTHSSGLSTRWDSLRAAPLAPVHILTIHRAHQFLPYNASVEYGELISATANEQGDLVSSVAVAGQPWAFTQNHPLGTSDFMSEAKRRGFDLDLSVLRELYRHNLVVPFVYASPRQAGPIPEPVTSEPFPHSSWIVELRHARDRGRLCDLAAMPFRPRLRFEPKEAYSRHWWNGLLYSRYQLLIRKYSEVG